MQVARIDDIARSGQFGIAFFLFVLLIMGISLYGQARFCATPFQQAADDCRGERAEANMVAPDILAVLDDVTVGPQREAIRSVIAIGRWAAARHWVPATSGNISVRIDRNTIAITRSGTDKGALLPADVLTIDLATPGPGASAEAPLHYAIYRELADIEAVVHVHSPAATVLSRKAAGDGAVRLQGWELQKAFSGICSHEEAIEIPVLANDQDTDRLAQAALRRLGGNPVPAYLIAGHGLYAWGNSAAAACRHAEALETLLSYQLAYERISP
jgi:methylthioribulose-1-phosphate dehydratase